MARVSYPLDDGAEAPAGFEPTFLSSLEPKAGIEPATYTLQRGCSSAELFRPIVFGAVSAIRTPDLTLTRGALYRWS